MLSLGHAEWDAALSQQTLSALLLLLFQEHSRMRKMGSHRCPVMRAHKISLRIQVHVLDCRDLLQSPHFPRCVFYQWKCLLTPPEPATQSSCPLPALHRGPLLVQAWRPLLAATWLLRSQACAWAFHFLMVLQTLPWSFTPSCLALLALLKALHLSLFNLPPATTTNLSQKFMISFIGRINNPNGGALKTFQNTQVRCLANTTPWRHYLECSHLPEGWRKAKPSQRLEWGGKVLILPNSWLQVPILMHSREIQRASKSLF